MLKQKEVIVLVCENLNVKVRFIFTNKKLSESEKKALEYQVWEKCRNSYICNFRATIHVTANRPEVESMFYKINAGFCNWRYKTESNYFNTPSTFLVATQALDNVFENLNKLNLKKVLKNILKNL